MSLAQRIQEIKDRLKSSDTFLSTGFIVGAVVGLALVAFAAWYGVSILSEGGVEKAPLSVIRVSVAAVLMAVAAGLAGSYLL